MCQMPMVQYTYNRKTLAWELALDPYVLLQTARHESFCLIILWYTIKFPPINTQHNS